jgi:pentatricopeptide repeat protein
VAIVYALGQAGRVDDAARVVGEMKGYADKKYQVEAYAWLAVAITRRDPARAASFVDRALAMPVDQPDEFQSWTYFGGGSGAAAWAVACAHRAGYPDMAGAVAHVLAARPGDRNRDPAQETQSVALAALVLGLTDPMAARQVLSDVATRSGLRSVELDRLVHRHWLMAWALADPKRAEELFDTELAALEGQRDINLQSTGLLKMAEILIHPRHRREAFLRREIGATWYPGMEQ